MRRQRGRPHNAKGNWKREVSLWNASNVYRPHYAGGTTTQQSPVILDLCLRKSRSEKSRGYRDAIVFEKAHSSLKLFSVNTKTQGRRFQIPPVCSLRAGWRWSRSVHGEANRLSWRLFTRLLLAGSLCSSSLARVTQLHGLLTYHPVWRAFLKSSVFVTDSVNVEKKVRF